MSVEISELMGIELSGIHVNNPLDIIKLSEQGVTKRTLIHIGKLLSLRQKDLAEMVSVSLRTLQRYDDSRKLTPLVSENIILITEVIRLGLEVFEDIDIFTKWLNNPNKALNQKKPLYLLKFRSGSNLVQDILGQIKYGIVA